jgi:hypothetical protein
MLALTARDTALTALGASWVSAHNGYPGPDGSANEMGNYGYARINEGFTAFGGLLSLDAPILLTVEDDFDWLGVWDDDAPGGAIVAIVPLGGLGRRYCVDPATDVFSLPAHGYANDQAVTVYGDAAAAGLTLGTVYYARDVTTNTFKVAPAIGDPAVNITDFPSAYLALISRYNVDSAAFERDVAVNSIVISLNG